MSANTENTKYWLQRFNEEHNCMMTLGEKLGDGLTGIVYDVSCSKLHPKNWLKGYPSGSMVLKVMHTDLEQKEGCSSPCEVEQLDRRIMWENYFKQEIEIMESLSDCPYTMPLYDHHIFTKNEAEHRKVAMLLMPKMQPLDKYWESQEMHLEEGELIQLSKDVTAALARCHEMKILHRDIKPDNIFVQVLRKGQCRYILGDFGCCRSFVKKPRGELTRVGNGYSDPRIDQGEVAPMDYTPDVYQLGRTLYHIITGQAAAPVEPKRLSMLSPEFRAFIMKATDPDPARRYRNGAEMAAALESTNGKSKTEIVINRNYRAAKRALCAGNYEDARRFAAIGIKKAEDGCGVVELYCRVRDYIQYPDPAKGRQLATDIDDLYLDTNQASALCLSAILARAMGEPQRAREEMRDAAKDGFIPAQYLYGRMLCDTSEGAQWREGLNYIMCSAELGYWDAQNYLREKVPHQMLHTRLQKMILQDQLEELEDPLGSEIRRLCRHRDAVASFL